MKTAPFSVPLLNVPTEWIYEKIVDGNKPAYPTSYVSPETTGDMIYSAILAERLDVNQAVGYLYTKSTLLEATCAVDWTSYGVLI